MKKNMKCCCVLFSVGGVLYGFIELIWRRYTHWSMILTGGLCFTVLYHIFRKIRVCSIWLKCCIGSTVITFIEFFAGFVFNFRMKMRVWDYSHCRFNFCGQICLLYSILWGLLTLPIFALCSFLDRKFRL